MPFWKSVVPHDMEIRRGERKFALGDRSFNGYENNKLWHNNGDGTFTEAGWAAGADLIVDSRACAVADFDRDGRLDLAVRAMFERAYFYRNEGKAGRFLNVRLVGTRSNRMGVGARVTAVVGGARFVREVTCGSAYLSQSEPAVHFGLGARDRVDRLVIRWPSGTRQEFRDVPADAFLTVTEGEEGLSRRPPREPAALPPAKGDPVTAVVTGGTYTDLEGRSARARFDGVTLLHVWSPACAGCESEAEILGDLATRGRVLAIAVESTREEVAAFVKRWGVAYPVLVADEATGRALREVGRGNVSRARRQFGGWFELGSAGEREIPWTGVVDRSGLQRIYRGPVKRFEALLDLLSTPER